VVRITSLPLYPRGKNPVYATTTAAAVTTTTMVLCEICQNIDKMMGRRRKFSQIMFLRIGGGRNCLRITRYVPILLTIVLIRRHRMKYMSLNNKDISIFLMKRINCESAVTGSSQGCAIVRASIYI
jgi:hypothetical protein